MFFHSFSCSVGSRVLQPLTYSSSFHAGHVPDDNPRQKRLFHKMRQVCSYYWLVTLLVTIVSAIEPDPRIHFILKRRGGRLLRNEVVNLTRILDIVEKTESRHARTHRVIEDNRVKKRWTSSTTGTTRDEVLMKDAGGGGNWSVKLQRRKSR